MTRVLTTVVLLPVVVYIVLAAHPLVFLAGTVAVCALSFREYVRMAAGHGIEIAGPLGYAAGVLLLAVPRQEFPAVLLLVVAGLTVALRERQMARVLAGAAALVFGVLYVFGPWRCAAGLRQISPHWLFFTLSVNWLGDMAAYLTGKLAGRHKLAPVISPAKTWEGSAGSLVISAAFGVLYLQRFLPGTPLWEAVMLAVVVNVAGQVGDLCESAMKRGANRKDSGTGLPGHGGWLDRVDSHLFSLPVVYFWLTR